MAFNLPVGEATAQEISSSVYFPESKIVLADDCRKLLEEYSGISPDWVIPHVIQVRKTAWKFCPYPCIGRFDFLEFSICFSQCYPTVLQRLKNENHTLLDLGCCFAQDVRKLVFDGAPSKSIYASDLRPEYWDLGYNLFHDQETLQTTFISADILDQDSGLKQIEGKIDILFAAHFFHLFSLDDQIRVVRRMVQILRRQKGSMVFGRQRGKAQAGDFVGKFDFAPKYGHNPATFKKMWDQVGAETGTSWKVEAELYQKEDDHLYTSDPGRLAFTAVMQ